ncbi:Phage P2 GpU [Cohaesibacter sp. ES.047]|uniref:phage tail protein n=1 Tax=Cohaesibacter sp. ES.047 TaxID=1798205 RepID=UPI000BB7661E|nr:phage tail protein [Cohaesibacter sp. ES.047]SNY91457.1 Phage P2 GpU [Cohaesibacter sp. ES.047]
MTVYAYLGDFTLGQSNAMSGPKSDSQTWGNTIHEHKVVRGKPVPQYAGEELDKRTLEFFFDESFCDPQTEYARLKAARSSGSVMPFTSGHGDYDGTHYQITSISPVIEKTTSGGRIVRLSASIELLEVPSFALSLRSAVSAVATAASAIINPLTRKS